jgi:hypothetical protein
MLTHKYTENTELYNTRDSALYTQSSDGMANYSPSNHLGHENPLAVSS